VGSTPTESAIDAAVKAFRELLGNIEIRDYQLFASPFEDRHPYEAEVVVKVNGDTYVGRGVGKTSAHTILNAVASAVSQYLSSGRRVDRV
jgi:hypothetical protein